MTAAPAPERDRAFMRRALSLARRGWGRTAPNPMVGAVVVRDGVVVGEGFHARFGAPHAEVVALRAAGAQARGATLYVSLEPCTHHGKTPPCTDAIAAAEIARVVVAAPDPHAAAAGGVERLRCAGLQVDIGVAEDAARELNAPFYHAHGPDGGERPWITLKLALSIDGAVADAGGRSRWITGPAARRVVHRLRAGHDAVAVGVGTAIADDPSLTVRGVRRPRRAPLRVVFDRQARLPLTAVLVRTAGAASTLVVTADPAPPPAARLREAGVTILPATDLPQALHRLRDRDVQSLLVEGGARLASALLERSLVDRLIIFRGAVVLGRGAVHPWDHLDVPGLAGARRFRVLSHRRVRGGAGNDLMTTYAPDEAECSPG